MHNFIKHTALTLGFDACGIAAARELTADKAYMKTWLENGMYGDMLYLVRNFEKRFNPALMVPGCKSVIVTLTNYFTVEKQPPGAPKIARYAWPEVDYHITIKQKLHRLEKAIREEYGDDCFNDEVQHLFVDSAPFAEKSFAQQAGLGWIGKNKLLISPVLGSFCYIGVLLINKEMTYDKPMENRCGSCTRCIQTCPTKALNYGVLDARSCISYFTLETKSKISETSKLNLSGYVKGCDICAEICPWNIKHSKQHVHKELNPTPEIFEWTKQDWKLLTKERFNKVFSKSAVRRGGFERLKELM
jgi:epoxyqueuosine reductase